MARQTPRGRLLRHSAAGIQFTLTFLLGLGGGYLLDRHLGTTPGFTANGGVIGFLLAVYRLFRQGREILDEEDKPPHAGPEHSGADEDEGSSQPGGQA